MLDEDDYINITIFGNCLTGKTSLINKWTKNIFTEAYKKTVTTKFGTKIFLKDDLIYSIKLWDISGQDNSSSLVQIFAKDSDGYIIMSDATDKQTREE